MISIGNRLFYQVALVAIFIRAVLIVYGEWQDRNLEVKYTDVDYWVFSGAATAILNGKSPYVRHTYRYTPLLAMLLLPNDWIGPWWGKTLFCAFDIISGYLIYLFLLRATNPTRAAYITGGFWLLNVMTFTISSRGNAESILCTLIVAFLYYLTSGRTFVSGIVYGASIHLKIFPVIFGMAILSFLCSGKYRKSIDIPTSPRLATPQKSPELVPSSSPSPSGSPTLKNRKKFANELALQRPSSLATPNKIRHINVSSPSSRIRKIFIFGLGTLLGFGVLTGICYWLYGREFLQEAYFYHLTRKDHRHNFSPYFYLFYTEALLALPKGFELLVFIPQFLFFFLAGLKFGKKDLPFACFIITFVFVTFNKVVTSQVLSFFIIS